MKICTFEGCHQRHTAKGYCQGHYDQWRRAQELKTLGIPLPQRECDFIGCGKKHEAKGYCQGHYLQFIKGQELRPINVVPSIKVCSFDGCDKLHSAKGYCMGHYCQLQRGNGIKPLRQFRIENREPFVWNQLTIGYLAAIIDGEGHIGSSKRINISVTSCDFDIIERAYNLSGIGTIQGPYSPKNPKHNNYWVWSVAKHKDIARLLCAIAPLICERKRNVYIVPMIERLSKAINRPKNCSGCGIEYTPLKSGAGVTQSKYCSNTCRNNAKNMARRKMKKGVKNELSWSGPL